MNFLERGSRAVWTVVEDEKTPFNDRKTHDSFYDQTVEEYAKRPLRKLSLTQMLDAGRDAWFDSNKILENARFTWEELPKRLARRLLDLQLLPYIVVTNPHIGQVYRAYRHAFDTLRDLPAPLSLADNENFSKLLRRLVDEHAPMLDALANGLREIKAKPLIGPHLHLDSFLEAMLRSRISRRILAEQHININNGRDGYIGIVCTSLSLADSVDFAAGRCRQVCIESYGIAPEVVVTGDTALKVPCIPAHLDYMLYELLKNAFRAVVENHRKKINELDGGGGIAAGLEFATAQMPAIHVRICGGKKADDVTIRISDQGGGIPFHLLQKVWEFGWTDLDSNSLSDEPSSISSPREGLGIDNTAIWALGIGGGSSSSPPMSMSTPLSSSTAAPTGTAAAGTEGGGGGRFRMAGLGFGLPLSRLYARYFGGDLRLVSMPGYGVDAYLYLKGLVVNVENKNDEKSGNGVADEMEGRSWNTVEDEEGLGALGVGPSTSAS